jgi:hypothetical protein
MVIIQYSDSVLIECPDRKTVLFSPDQIDPSILQPFMRIRDDSHVDYVIAPVSGEGVAGQWIILPGPFTRTIVHYGDIDITVDTTLSVTYGDQEFIYRAKQTTSHSEESIRYTISNGVRTMQWAAAVSGTLFDDLVTELWMMGAQLLLLF